MWKRPSTFRHNFLQIAINEQLCTIPIEHYTTYSVSSHTSNKWQSQLKHEPSSSFMTSGVKDRHSAWYHCKQYSHCTSIFDHLHERLLHWWNNWQCFLAAHVLMHLKSVLNTEQTTNEYFKEVTFHKTKHSFTLLALFTNV